jgi:hypothetical protein
MQSQKGESTVAYPVEVSLERNESHPDGQAVRPLGRFEFVQITYASIRNDKDEDLAFYINGYWIAQDSTSWSDIIISGVRP